MRIIFITCETTSRILALYGDSINIDKIVERLRDPIVLLDASTMDDDPIQKLFDALCDYEDVKIGSALTRSLELEYDFDPMNQSRFEIEKGGYNNNGTVRRCFIDVTNHVDVYGVKFVASRLFSETK
jgi:hypothetical protein